ncbi:CIA30 family protein [Salinibacter grassmerensis]|uniref:CIA30 family protein n=1 Tax=Salinibacter grassmerensis TaxID=3040353 RepID=UPI0021E72EEC|nr:CIA30 family protein [Salinibacter grassmerensis]
MPRLLVLAVATAALGLTAHANFAADAHTAPGSAEATAILLPCLADADRPHPLVSFGPVSPPTPKMLFNFDGADTAPWRVENDGVMGGRSEGFVEVADGTLTFTGEVVTEGGGFTSVRAASQADLSGYDGIELRVRGGGRTFELDVDDGTRSQGREVSAYGEPVRVDPLDLSAVQSIGIYIIDGQDGPFRLEVDWIRAYREAE